MRPCQGRSARVPKERRDAMRCRRPRAHAHPPGMPATRRCARPSAALRSCCCGSTGPRTATARSSSSCRAWATSRRCTTRSPAGATLRATESSGYFRCTRRSPRRSRRSSSGTRRPACARSCSRPTSPRPRSRSTTSSLSSTPAESRRAPMRSASAWPRCRRCGSRRRTRASASAAPAACARARPSSCTPATARSGCCARTACLRSSGCRSRRSCCSSRCALTLSLALTPNREARQAARPAARARWHCRGPAGAGGGCGERHPPSP